MYKIFINDSVLIIADTQNVDNIEMSNSVIQDQVATLFRTILSEINPSGSNTYYLFSDNPKNTMMELQQTFKFIRAAGGLVVNKNNQYLAIKRNKKWDFPKGKLDKGERMRTAAKREVMEETGIKQLNVLEKAITTYHAYIIKKNIYLKKTNWYHMVSFYDGPLLPQEDEGITKVRWVDIEFLNAKKIKTFQSIKEIISFLNTTA